MVCIFHVFRYNVPAWPNPVGWLLKLALFCITHFVLLFNLELRDWKLRITVLQIYLCVYIYIYIWTVRESNPGGGEIFRNRPERPWGPPSPLNNGYRIFPGGKAAGAWRWPPTPSSAKVKERLELYHYSTSGPSWPVIGWTLPFQIDYHPSPWT
jgi:hypothetical protein